MHVGIIMDGNRRWAKQNGVSKEEGHYAGFETLKKTITWSRELGVQTLTVFAFSTENWKRDESEVSALLQLFRHGISELQKNEDERVQVRFIGRRDDFPQDIQDSIRDIEQETESMPSFTLVVALSYGGRAEILNAVNTALQSGKTSLTEEEFSQFLYTRNISDPDIIIRTSGEHRTSGFLTWQAVYSELFFTDTLWPDFSREEYERIIHEYYARERRYGK